MSKESELKVFAAIGLIVLAIILIPGIALAQAWILQHVWAWYAVAQFGLPALRLSHCFLFSYAVSLLIKGSMDQSDKKEPWANLAGSVLSWLIFLGLAWWLR